MNRHITPTPSRRLLGFIRGLRDTMWSHSGVATPAPRGVHTLAR